MQWTILGINDTDITSFTIELHDTSGHLEDKTVIFNVKKSTLKMFTEAVSVAAFTRYRISMKSCILTVCGILSMPKFFTTMEDAPGPITKLTSVVEEDVITLHWQKPLILPGILRYFIIDLKRQTSGLSQPYYPKNASNISTSFKLNASCLSPNEKHYVEVSAVTTKKGPPKRTYFVSPEGIPSKPKNVTAVLIKSDMISVKWSPPNRPNGVLLGYKVRLFLGFLVMGRRYLILINII